MKWWLSNAQEPVGAIKGNGSMEEAVRQSIMLSTVHDLLRWCRKNSMWPFHFGLSCCFVEMATSMTPKYDVARFGAEVISRHSTRSGCYDHCRTVFIKMAPIIKRLHEQMMEPRWVISMVLAPTPVGCTIYIVWYKALINFCLWMFTYRAAHQGPMHLWKG